MRQGGFHDRALRGLAAALLALAAPLALTACTPTSYAGISLKPGAADPELQSLARRAQAGDKHAQLELGIRYEEGRGLPPDLAQAVELYALASQTTGGTVHIYVPNAGRHRSGQVMAVDRGPLQLGLPEAGVRLRKARIRIRSPEAKAS